MTARAASCLVAITAGLAALAGTARADRLDTTLAVGGAATATVESAGDVATVGFLVTDGVGRKLSLQVAKTKKPASDLVPDVRLIAPDGTRYAFNLPGEAVTPAGAAVWKAKLPDVPQSGLWRIEVRGANGTSGAFTASVKGKDVLSLTRTPPPLGAGGGGKQEIVIEVGENAALSLSTKRAAGSKTIVPKLEILDANGALLEGGTFVAVEKTGVMKVKAFRLPVFGRYTLRFTSATSAGGQFSFVAKTAPAKFKGAFPVADAGAHFEVEPGLDGSLDGSTSTAAAGQTLTYRWTQVSGPPVALVDADKPRAKFTAGVGVGSLAFQLAVAEAGRVSRAATVGVEVAKRPIADAGRSFHDAGGAAVTLDGTGSTDRRETGLRFAWRQIPGDTATVTLSGADTARPSFTPPSGDHVLHFGLVVDDGTARSFEDVVVVAVGAPRAVADAGREQYVPRMASVHLCGLASKRTFPGVLDAGLSWTQVEGPPLVDRNGERRDVEAKDTPWPSFTAPRRAPADMRFKLTLGGDEATADFVWVRVRSDETNLPAPARANGPLNTASGPVTMAATGASFTVDPDGDALSFQWGQAAGTALPIETPGAASAATTVPAGNAQYLFAVQANDGLQYGAPDLVGVRNSGFDGAPIALAGADRTAPPLVNVFLDGSASVRTSGAGPLTYRWTQVSGRDWFDVAASVPSFDPTAAVASFSLPAEVSSLTPTRTILFQLVVNDGTAASLPDFMTVTFTNLPLNARPLVTASATELNPTVGQVVRLLGTAVDSDGDPVTVRWTQTSGTIVALSPNATELSPSFAAPDSTAPLVFRLVANDGIEDGAPRTVTIVVDRKPVATVVVSPTQGPPGTQVTMDGTGSSDPEGRPLTYRWTEVPGGAVASTGSTFVFSAPAGAVSYQLVVNDGRQNSDPRTAGFSGSPPPTVSPSAATLATNPDPSSTAGPPSGVAGFACYGARVTLSANPSGGGGSLSFTWRVISQTPSSMPAITLSSASAQNPTFTVPLPTTAGFGFNPWPEATFGVVARDSIQSSAEGTITIRFFASLNNGTASQTTNVGTETVYGIVNSRCTSCHSGTNNSSTSVGSGNNASGYGMGTRLAFLNNSRGVTALSSSRTRLPAAGSPLGLSTSSAYLYDRITGTATPQMPSSGGNLSSGEQALFQDWIDQGVLDN